MDSEPDGTTLRLDPEEFVHVITNTTTDAIVTIDANSTILFANAAVERIFGHAAEGLLGKSLTLLMPDYLRHVHEQSLARYVETGQRHVDWTGVALVGLHRDGHQIGLEVAFGESVSRGRPIFTGVIRDVSDRYAQDAVLRAKEEELERMNQRLLHDALHDALTDLPNRVLLVDRLEQVLRRRKDDPSHDAALLFLDFDRFKNVNDSLGHAVGDAMLVAIGHVLEAVVRPEDTVARFGGDEFVILLDHVDSPERPVELAERIAAALEEPLRAGDHQIYTSASIGIVPSMFDYEDAHAVLRDGDTAMYGAKAMGRGSHKVFDHAMRSRAIFALDLETDLRQALERGEFCVRYAPIHRVATREVVGFEALVHWQHPERGLLPPSEFLGAATELGIMRRIDAWVWREAGRNVSAWRARSGRRLLLSLNFSRQHFLSPSPERMLLEILHETGSDPGQTVIELDESALHGATDKTAAALHKVAGRGIGVHLDDFGTDHASLYDLHRFSIDALKIDHGIVAGMTDDPKDEELVIIIVGLAGNLGLEVVAEGVEEESQLRILADLGCAYAQGHLFSQPLDEEQAVAYLRAHDGGAGATDARRG